MGGGMETNKNRFIEEWSSARENLEHNFRWTRRNLALVGLFGIAIPIFVYKGIVKEFPLIRIDYFRRIPNEPSPLACFLSHVHSDHLLGLESLKAPFIYCSPATREVHSIGHAVWSLPTNIAGRFYSGLRNTHIE